VEILIFFFSSIVFEIMMNLLIFNTSLKDISLVWCVKGEGIWILETNNLFLRIRADPDPEHRYIVYCIGKGCCAVCPCRVGLLQESIEGKPRGTHCLGENRADQGELGI